VIEAAPLAAVVAAVNVSYRRRVVDDGSVVEPSSKER
jgi:hypothetical protein